MMVSSRISTPIFFRFSISASMMTSGRRNSGMPYFSTPPATCSASKMVTLTPLRASSPAQARPDGPEPMMAAFFWAAAAGGRELVPSAPHGAIGHEPLQPSDGHRLVLGPHHASGLALRFLRAHAPAHRRQRVGALQNLVRALDVLPLEGGDEAGNVDPHRAARHAARLLAAQAALGFVQRAFQVQPQRHFLEIVPAHFRPAAAAWARAPAECS